MMSNCTNQPNTTNQATPSGIDLDKLDRELDSILSSLARDHKGSVRESVSDIRAMVEAARQAAKPKSGGFCSKLESPCGDDPWGWCQSCPKRAAEQASPAPAAGTAAVEEPANLSFRSIDDGPEFEALLFAYRDTEFITGQMRDIIAYANNWLHSALKAHVKRIRQLERELEKAKACAATPNSGDVAVRPAVNTTLERALFDKWCKSQDWGRSNQSDDWEVWLARAALDQAGAPDSVTASSALHACITYVVHGDADFSGMDEALVSYFKAKVLTSRTLPSSLQAAMAKGAWKLLPVTLTEDMLVAFAEAWYSKKRCIDDCEMDDAYAALLAAAPTPSFYQDTLPGFTAVEDQLVNEMHLYFDANANVSDECADFLERLTQARVADASNNQTQPESGWQGLPPIGERESIMDVCGLPRLMRNILESKGSPDSLGQLYDFISAWGDARFEFGYRTASGYLTAKGAQPTDIWRVGEFWSSGSPGTKVLMLSRGAEIASHEKHESFLRWVGASSIHGYLSAPAASAGEQVT